MIYVNVKVCSKFVFNFVGLLFYDRNRVDNCRFMLKEN